MMQDNIYDMFARTGTFEGKEIRVPRRINDLITCIVWHILLDLPLFYYALPALLTSTVALVISALTIVIGL